MLLTEEEVIRIKRHMQAAFRKHERDPRNKNTKAFVLMDEHELFALAAAQSDLITNLRYVMEGAGTGKTPLWNGSPDPEDFASPPQS